MWLVIAKALAYCATELIMAVKSFMIQAPGVNVKKLFFFVTDISVIWFSKYEESVVDKFKSNLLLMIFRLDIINYNS
jgi:hypothetical protein